MALSLVTEEQSQGALEQMVSDSCWGSSSSPASRGQELEDGLGMRASTALSSFKRRDKTQSEPLHLPPSALLRGGKRSPRSPQAPVRRLGNSGKTDIFSDSSWWCVPPCLTPFPRTMILRLLRRSSYRKAFSCSLQYAPCRDQNILVGRCVPLGYHRLCF